MQIHTMPPVAPGGTTSRALSPRRAAKAPAAGNGRSCAQCGVTYLARRSTSQFCGNACRQRAHRGTPPKACGRLDMLQRWLLRRGFAGPVGAGHALTAPRSAVLAELHESIRALRANCPDLTTLAPMTEAEFSAALKALAILDYGEAAEARQVKP